ncbi:polysaccharide deacetylase [Anaerobacterium chartisolvens]|uniref:Polysaccharide deacetylase n=1 Tax=Anaerobacterium chartisolvens TaxID=1297424 RepID=A0A369B6Y0_9FIRM|nr:polysaccharide deacetylase family protein [Anaerobacterium chartisolvens]RCX16287.1 polysaccharide deacetylase [Anaerobacterium chartisolvens]
MKKAAAGVILAFSMAFLLSGCAGNTKFQDSNTKTEVENQASTAPSVTQGVQQGSSGDEASTGGDAKGGEEPIDLSKVKPNESGKIMVVMFHNFVEEYKSGDKEYTTTFALFEKLLEDLYGRGYRLISMKDYIENNIDVPAGCIPMVFTFDDGSAGQFNLIEENGRLVANRKSAVGVMEEFNKKHPDFGFKATFYVNLGGSTFSGKGTISERLSYLIDKGFEIGNHTLNHSNLRSIDSSRGIMEEVGGNQKALLESVPGYKMESLALPLGRSAKKELKQYVIKGEYDGVAYENKCILLVGANPAPSPVSKKLDLMSLPRVRAAGIKTVDADLEWWLENISEGEQYISDGNPDTVTLPSGKEDSIDKDKLKGKQLVVY